MNAHQKGVEFERTVAELFRSLGARRVVHNSIIDGSQIDLFVENVVPGAAANIKMVIECKDFARPVGVDAVNGFAIVFRNLRYLGKVDIGILISRSGFTTQAKAAAATTGIQLLELEDLIQQAKESRPTQEKLLEIEEVQPDRKYVFVLMPFDEAFDNVFWFGIRGAVEDAGLYCERADEIQFTGNVLDKINEHIRKADVIVAEMTGRNPNVFYEVGIAHTAGKSTVLLVQDADDIPFDMRNQNHLVYNPNDIKGLRERLTKLLKALTS